MNGSGTVYVFAAGELDSARHRLVVDGRQVDLEPKAFAVLADLLAHAGTLRSRDDLLDAVWGHRHVTPAVLNRCIGQLRKALGDHADEPRFIQTVHTLGYRFIAPVTVRHEAVPASPESVEAPAPAAPPRARRRRVWWALAAGVAAVTLVVLLLPRQSGDSALPVGDVVANAPRHVVVLPFEIPVPANQLRPAVRSLESMLAQRLAASPGLRIARDVAQAPAGATQVVARVVGPADAWALLVEVRDPAAKTPWQRRYPLRLAGLGQTASSLQDDVLRRVRPDSALLTAEGATRLDAEQFLRSGERAAAGLQQRDRRDAIANFRRALELDPTNATAWCHLGDMHLMAAYENLKSIESVVPPASEAIERGLRLDPASALCLQAKGALLRLQRRTEEAATHYRRALALDPTLFDSTLSLALIEDGRLRFTRTRELFERIVAEHPEKGWPHCQLIGAYEMTGDVNSARALEPIVYERHPELRNVNWKSASVDLTYGRMAAGIRRYQALADWDKDDRSYHLVASYAASEILATALSKSELDKAGMLETAHYPQANVWLFYALGDPDGALAWLREATLPPSLALVQRGWQAQSLALAGRRDEALAEYARVFEDGYENEDPTMNSQGSWIYSAQLMNYATLLGPGARRDDAVAAAARHLAQLRADGLGLPWVHYQAAQIAVLRGQVETAMQELDRALDAGYGDALSLYRDLVWREVADDPRFQSRKSRLQAYAAEQRRLLAAGDAIATTAR